MSQDKKTVYTTGEAAKICHLSQQTIIRCFDNGTLNGFRIPGSKFRRIPHNSLVQFMRRHNIPLDALDSGAIRVLIVDNDQETIEPLIEILEADGRFEIASIGNGYHAGVLTEQMLPDVMILNDMLPDIPCNVVCQTLRQNPNLEHIKVLIVSGETNRATTDLLMETGADAFIQKPWNVETIIDKIISLVNK